MGGQKKEYLPLPGLFDAEGAPLSVLASSVAAFAAFPEIDPLVIAVPADSEDGEYEARACLPRRFLDPALRPSLIFVPGGKTRRASVYHALSLLTAYRPGYVLIHDGGRPWVDADLIRRTMEAVIRYRAAVPVLPLVETPKMIEEPPESAAFGEAASGDAAAGTPMVIRHLRRASVVTAQTPQGFAFPEILRAHEKAAEKELAEGREYTDDAEIWGEFCGPVAAVPGAAANKKITFPEDLEPRS
jgi:2-C-methyl-D-erythritol 4-phosphate cytidylyltransferase